MQNVDLKQFKILDTLPLYLCDTRIYIPRELRKVPCIKNTWAFAQALVKTRMRMHKLHAKRVYVMVPIVLHKCTGEVVDYGRATEWKNGIAGLILNGMYHTSVLVVFNNIQYESSHKLPMTVTRERGNSLDSAPSMTRICAYGYSMQQGSRRHMEDECVITADMETLMEGYSNRKLSVHKLFSVYDGHNGREAVERVRNELHRRIANSKYFPMNIPKAFRQAYRLEDEQFIRDSKLHQWESGSTAVSVLLNGDRMVVCHVGDSRAVLSKKGIAVALTEDHAPGLPSETKRIQGMGGFVRNGLVGNLLSVSRCFGDFDPDTKEKLRGVSCEPDIHETLLTDEDELIILASDGFWEKFSAQNAVTYARRSLIRHGDVHRTSEELVSEALRRGSTDNVSAIVVSFHDQPGFSWYRDETIDHKTIDNISLDESKRPRISKLGLFSLEAALTV